MAGDVPYQEKFAKSSRVCIQSRAVLEKFQREWHLHHPLQSNQLAFAGVVARVGSVGFYHGGDVLYEVEGVPGTWHQVCLLGDETVTAKSIVLVSRTGYRGEHDALLRGLIARRIESFYAVGQDCELWEDSIDWLVLELTDDDELYVTTSSYPDESVDEVVELARAGGTTGVEIIEV